MGIFFFYTHSVSVRHRLFNTWKMLWC